MRLVFTYFGWRARVIAYDPEASAFAVIGTYTTDFPPATVALPVGENSNYG